MKTIVEPARELPIIEDVDVVVAGGGPKVQQPWRRPGEAARLLVERYILGGMATGGLMGPLFGYAWARGPLLLGGIGRDGPPAAGAERSAHGQNRLAAIPSTRNPSSTSATRRQRRGRPPPPAWVVDVVRQGDRIEAVIIESKSGRQAITAKRFIDATGDGDIAAAAGCEYTKGRRADGRTQPMGTKFKIGGVDMPKATAALKESRDLVNRAIDEKRILTMRSGARSASGASPCAIPRSPR